MFFVEKPHHPFHLLIPSPWPLFLSRSLLGIPCTYLGWTYFYDAPFFDFMLFSCFLGSSINSWFWWRDVSREASGGYHVLPVTSLLRNTFSLFIISEIMFFVAIFWRHLHRSLGPTYVLGSLWPPYGMRGLLVVPFTVPWLNTVILLSSAVTVTVRHYALLNMCFHRIVQYLFLTIVLAILFTSLQVLEYGLAKFTIYSGVFGSVFFLSTGFHGIHVIVGTLYLIVSLYRLTSSSITLSHAVGYEIAIWYYHFVDVVWLLLFIIVYWWRSLISKLKCCSFDENGVFGPQEGQKW